PSICTACSALGFRPSIARIVGAICLVETSVDGAMAFHLGYDTTSGTCVSLTPNPPCSACVVLVRLGSKFTPLFMTTTTSGTAGSDNGFGNGKPDPNEST